MDQSSEDCFLVLETWGYVQKFIYKTDIFKLNTNKIVQVSVQHCPELYIPLVTSICTALEIVNGSLT